MTNEQAKKIADELRLKQGLGVPAEHVAELVLHLYDEIEKLNKRTRNVFLLEDIAGVGRG